MSGKNIKNIFDLTQRELGISASKLTPETSLFHDCGVAGLDGKDFMMAFAKEFEVDMGMFRSEDYFGAEAPLNPFLYLWNHFFESNEIKIKRLPLRHLLQVTQTKKWFNPSE
jgi:hypothetical protein